jgi:iron complex outermembrane recepter protein
MTSRRSVLLLASAAAAATAMAGQACAQASAPAADIETVIVTAQKREEDIQDVPISMEVVGGEQLDKLRIADIQALQSYVPNLLVQNSPGNNAIFLRGFGSQAANYAFDQSVSLYVDGIYGGRNRQFMAPFFDIERVEVLRGPQGALLGKNTAAGAISIVTASPKEHFEGSATGSYNFDRDGYEVWGYVTGPLGVPGLSGRVAAKYTDLEGYIKNTALGRDDPSQKNNLLRLSLRYNPSENVDIVAKYEYDRFSVLGTNAIRVSATNPVITNRKAAGSPFGVPEFDRQISNNLSLTANIGLGEYTLTSLTGYSEYKDRKDVGGSAGNDPENWLSIFAEDFHQRSQEIRLLSPTGGRFEWILGAYYDNSDYDMFNPSRYSLFGNTVVGQVHVSFAQNAETWSAFGFGTWRITEQLRLLGSLRYTNNKKSGVYDQRRDFGIPLSAPRAFLASIDENNTDPSVTVQYDVLTDVMLYATYGRGSKAGGFVSNARTINASQFVFGPEESRNYEVGVKSAFLDRRLILNLALYDTKFRDLQVATYDSTTATSVTKNAAAATSKGFEANAVFTVTDGLRLSGSTAYLDAKYDSFPQGVCLATAPRPCLFQDLAGITLPGASKWSGNVQAELARPINDALMFTGAAVVTFRSGFFTASDQSPIYGRQEGYAKVDARIGIEATSGRWSLALLGRNLTDKKTQSFGYLWPLSATPVVVWFLDETRNVSLQAQVRF